MSVGWSWCDFLAGWGGGVFGLVVGHPLDTLKVRQQTIVGSGTIWALTKFTYKNEGIRGFFKGLSYPAFMSGIYTSLLFGVYGNTLRALEKYRGTPEHRMCCDGDPVGPRWHQDVFVAGCVGGSAVVMVSCPIDLIKIKLQAQQAQLKAGDYVATAKKMVLVEPVYKGPWHAVRVLYSKYGIRKGLYRGTCSMLWRDVPTFGLYMIAYEHILCMFKTATDRSPDTSLTSQIVAGGIAGILSWIVVMPLDVVKSRIQGDDFSNPRFKGMIDCLVKTYRGEGVRALFLGTVLVCVRAFPANAATFKMPLWREEEKKKESSIAPLLLGAAIGGAISAFATWFVARKNNEEELRALAGSNYQCVDDDCSICLENGNCKLPCGHKFHRQCIINWLKTNNTCPLCRQVVPAAYIDQLNR